jgi:IMP dehydrogenase
MASLLAGQSRSLREFRLLPGYTAAEAGMAAVSLRSPLCCDPGDPGYPAGGTLDLEVPILSAAMQAVTGREMAIAIAQHGGIGVLPASQAISQQCELVESVKRWKAGFQTDLVTLSPQQTLGEVAALMRETGYRRFPVTDTGLFHGHLLGVLCDKDFDARSDLGWRVADRMRKDVQVGVAIEDLADANRLMIEHGRGFLPIVSQEGTLLSVVFKKDRDKHLSHPAETVDHRRRLRVAAAVSTHPEDRERARELFASGVDCFVIDASDGHTRFQADTIGFLRQLGDRPVIAGNVVTAAGFEFLADAGADAVKVGMGIGSGCITQQVKATGRGQATALAEVADARDRRAQDRGQRLPLIADGGLSGPAEIVVALALGADSVMLGNLLARFSESAGRRVRGPAGEDCKEYWMEGSERAHNLRRYAHTAGDFFAEGVEGFVPHAGSIDQGLPKLTAALRSALSTAGCASVAELQERAVLEPVSAASLGDSAVRGMTAGVLPVAYASQHA